MKTTTNTTAAAALTIGSRVVVLPRWEWVNGHKEGQLVHDNFTGETGQIAGLDGRFVDVTLDSGTELNICRARLTLA